jgi:crossover junction endodeoxyribonuclease RuvC
MRRSRRGPYAALIEAHQAREAEAQAKQRRPSGADVKPVARPRIQRVLGLDPGSIRTGWGVVEAQPGNARGVRGVSAGVIRVPEKAELSERLKLIFAGVKAVIAEHQPCAIAIEDIFFARYPQAALMLGHARGVALLAAAEAGFSVATYPPAVVKRSIVGSGRAEKSQVALLVGAVLGLRDLPSEDASDALAIALTHFNATRLGV